LDTPRIGDYTFESAVQTLRELEAEAEDEPKRYDQASAAAQQRIKARGRKTAKAFVALSAILRQQPETIEKALGEIRKGANTSRSLLHALAASGAEPAQSALLSLLSDERVTGELRRDVASGLIRVALPTEKTVHTLVEMLDDADLHVHAAYGLGTMARKLRERGEVVRADRISDVLVKRMLSAEDVDEKAILLRGIANAGDTRALNAVRPFLSSEVATIRLAAVQALRLMAHPDVDHLLSERLEKEERADVKQTVFDTISVRPASDVLVNALQHAALTDKESARRLQAVRILGRWIPRFDQLKAFLGQVAVKDAEAKVREAAQQAINT
jgi:hypothetical protein